MSQGQGMTQEPALQGIDTQELIERSPQRLFVLKEGDTFLVADVYGDVTGAADGLFVNDTRLLSTFRLRFGGHRPSLLSGGVSQDNVFFAAHMTNQPLPPLGASATPEGVVHVERERLLWCGRIFERISLFNYGHAPVRAPLTIHFGADFRDMFEVRGQQRSQRGVSRPAVVEERTAQLSYEGLDKVLRSVSITFSEVPAKLDEFHAEFLVDVPDRTPWVLYMEVGPSSGEPPGRIRHRAAASSARRSMRKRQRRGARTYSSARLFQHWMDKSRADLALLTTELPTGPYPYAGIPWFSTPFGRDAIVTALQTLWLDTSLAHGVMSFLARNQAVQTSTFRDSEPGKIMHETRKGEMAAVDELPFAKYYGGVDTTPLFIVLAGAYAARMGGADAVDAFWPALNNAARWIERSSTGNADGFLTYARGESSGLANQGWKDSDDSVFHEDGSSPEGPIALIEVQGYAYRAYLTMAELAAAREEDDAAAHWKSRAEALRRAVEQRFWLDDLQFYALALDGTGRPCRVRSSNVGHLLYCGLPSPKRAQSVIRQLLTGAFDSGWGIRTLPPEAARYNPMSYHNGSVWPHDVVLCAAGMARYGERDGIVHLMSGMFEAAAFFGMRLPELFCGFKRDAGEPPIAYPVACLPQAWAAGSVFMLLQATLGLQVDTARMTLHVNQPRLPHDIDRLQVRHMKVGDQLVDLGFQRVEQRVVAFIENQHGSRQVHLSVHY
ncbi:amylo-alpha-1,6-glucosidase [Variovorax sp. Sphag1AA]|uniref:amylo-alpha-1,6-glucosidase n=1 Tax=Variovorax sp. Sphag1AA TaxID=2587027 RepID=UPI0017D82809|nr:amylo-alpha-1,6-glucosidase [Variovorax sp. Sphag1AA]MBB3178215.1 glycogen debranching enzyme [Variovorax sp. Sphag1AA]